MKKALAILLSVLLLLATVPLGVLSATAADDPGVVENTNFNDGELNGWVSDSKLSVEDGALKFECTQDWALLYKYANGMKPNTEYLYTFKAKANKNTNMLIRINDNWAKDTARETVDLTTAWQEFSIVMNSGDCTGPILMFSANAPASAGLVYYIDDIVIAEYAEPEVPADDNLIVNGDFETGDAIGWETWQSTSISADAAKDGAFGAHLVGNGSWGGMLNQTMTVEAGKEYKLSFWINVNANGVNCLVRDGSGYSIEGAGGWFDTNKKDTLVEWTFTAPDNSILINFCGTGNNVAEDVYVDNFSLVCLTVDEPEVPDEPANLIVNGDFETGDHSGWEIWQSTSISTNAAKDGFYGAHLKGNGGWGGMLNQTMTVEAGKEYKLSFWINVNANGANVQVKDGSGRSIEGAGGWFDSNKKDHLVEWTFTAPDNSILINFCGAGNNVAEDVYVDNFSLVCLSEGGNEPAEPSNDGYIINGDFETGDIKPWENLWGSCPIAEVVEDGKDSKYALNVVSRQWCHVRQTGIAVEANTDYKITAWAKNANNMSLLVKDGNDTKDIINVGVNAGDEWTEFVAEFNSGDYTSIIFSLMGGEGTDQYGIFDNIVMEKVGDTPDADSVLTIPQANELGLSQDKNTYTEGKYYVTGKIVAIPNSTYGNMYIVDENDNQFMVYGTFGADGEIRYDALEYIPVVGDTVTVYGIIGTYNGTEAQMKNGWITEIIKGEGEPENTDPAADSTLSVQQAIDLALSKLHNVYTENKYYVTAEITEIYNGIYGNMYVKDADGNTLTIYGTWSEDGTVRFDAMETKPVVGDTVKLYGIIGQYNGTPQMKNAWIVAINPTDEPVANEADFDTIVTSNANGDSKYTNSYTTESGWIIENSAIQTGGTTVMNPQFPVIGEDNSSKAVCMNGKVGASGKITSPILSGGINKLTINYTKMFTDTLLSATVTITDMATGAVYTQTFSREEDKNTKYEIWTYEWVLENPIAGDFTIVISNDCPSQATGNKDRMTILDVIWETTGSGSVTPPVEPDEPDVPVAPDEPSVGVVDAPVAGTAYKFGMIQGNVSATDVYYLKGCMNGFYMDTAADVSAAVDVYLEKTAGGYYLYAMVNGVKTYINMVVSADGLHVNGAYEAAPSTVYTYDADAKTVIAAVDGDNYWFGTRNDKTYTTVGPCNVEYAGFYCQFYAVAGGETPDTPDQPDEPVAGDVLNATFDGGEMDGMQSSSDVSVADGVLQFNVTADWGNVYSYINVEANTDYTVSFRAKSKLGKSIWVKFNNNWAADVARADASIGTEWSDYSVTLNSGDCTSLVLLMQYNGFAADGETIWFDYIVISKASTEPDLPDVPDEPETPDEPSYDGYIVNGDFETGDHSGWETWQSTSISTDAAKDGSYGAHLVGGGNWGGLLNQTMTVEAGKVYKLSFWINVNATGVNCQVKDGSGYAIEGAGGWFDANKKDTLVEWTFVATDDKVLINFCGSGSAPEDAYVDNFSLVCLTEDSDEPDTPDQPDAPVGDVLNATFDGGETDGIYSSSDIYVVDGALQFNVTQDWGNIYTGIEVEANTDYIVSFRAKSKLGKDFSIQFLKQDWSGDICQETVSIGKEWKEYSCTMNTGDNTYVYLLMIYLGIASEGETIWFDYITVSKADDSVPDEPVVSGGIVNGGFENGSEGWELGSSASITDENSHTGNYSLKLENPAMWSTAAMQKVPVKPNTEYVIEMWVNRIENKGAMDLFMMNAADNRNLTIVEGQNWFNTNTNGWEKRTIVIETGTASEIILKWSAESANAGIMLIDDMTITEKNAPPAPSAGLVTNGDFETGDTTGWETWQSTVVSEEAAHSGKYGAHLIGNGDWGSLLNQTFAVEKGETYVITLWICVNASGVNLQIKDADKIDEESDNIWMNSGELFGWTKRTFTVVANGNEMTLNFFGGGNNVAADIYLDEIVVTKKGEVPPADDTYPIKNAGFESGELTPWINLWDSCFYSFEAGGYKGSNYALNFEASGQWQQIRQNAIPVKPNTDYVLVGYVKNPLNVNIVVKTGDDSSNIKEVAIENDISGKWIRAAVEFNSGNQTDICVLLIAREYGASAIFDDVQIYKKGEEPTDVDNSDTVIQGPLYLDAYGVVINRPASPEVNLIQNGSFENAQGGQWQSVISDTLYVVDDETAPDGDKSLFFNTSGVTENNKVIFYLDVEPNTDYVFSAWVKGAYISDDNRFNATFGVTDWKDNFCVYSDDLFSNRTRQIVPTAWDNQWHLRSVQFNSGVNNRIGIGFAGAESQMWIDDIALYTVENGVKYDTARQDAVIRPTVLGENEGACSDEHNQIVGANMDSAAAQEFWASAEGFKNGFVSFPENEYEYGTSMKYVGDEDSCYTHAIKWLELKPNTKYTFSVDVRVVKSGGGRLALLDGKMLDCCEFLAIDFNQHNYGAKWTNITIEFDSVEFDRIGIAIVDGGGEALIDNMRLFESEYRIEGGIVDEYVDPPYDFEDPDESTSSAVIEFTDIANRVSYSTSQQVWKQNGITVINNKGASTSNVGDYGGEGYPARFYKNSTVTIQYPHITKIVIHCDNLESKYVEGWADSFSADATAIMNGTSVVIIPSEPVDSFTWEMLSAQCRAYSITVYTDDLAVLLGDVNGDGKVNNRDVGLLQRYLNGWDVEVIFASADMNDDGKVNNRDLGLLWQSLLQ